MKKIIAFIILVILVILIICLSYNYYKKQDAQKAKVNKLKTDLETSEILDNKNKNDADSDKIEVEEKDTNSSESDSDEEESSKSNSKEKDKSNDSSKSKKSTDSNKSNDDSSDEEDVIIDDDGETEEETNVNVPDTASNDNNGFVKLNSFSIDLGKYSLKVGESTNVIVKYNPSNASVKDTTFVSENKNCKVSSLGKVTGLKKGTCSILVKVKNQNSKSLLLTVK
jgi:FtsZ-interacting cell division protein ZipA